MNDGFSRLILPEDLPESLWRRDERVLCLPTELSRTWLMLLDRYGIRTIAEQARPRKGPVGGTSKQDTDEHLAWSFTSSAARAQLAMLDPESELPHIADAFARIFAGGRVAVADLPCGSAAVVLALLTTVAELRRQGCVPREPLDVVLVGGEISSHARGYGSDATEHLKASLAEQGIHIEQLFMHWDVCDALSNSDLIRELTLRSQDCGARMLVMANFSGFLQGAGKLKDAQPQLEELFRHSRDENSSVIWIEPQTNTVLQEQGGLFSRLAPWLSKAWARFVHRVQPEGESEPVAKSRVNVVDCMHPDERFEVRLAVMRFDLRLNR